MVNWRILQAGGMTPRNQRELQLPLKRIFLKLATTRRSSISKEREIFLYYILYDVNDSRRTRPIKNEMPFKNTLSIIILLLTWGKKVNSKHAINDSIAAMYYKKST